MSHSYDLVPAGDVDYFTVTFSNANSCSYHPKVVLTETAPVTNLLRLEVTTDGANGTTTCNTAGDSVASSTGIATSSGGSITWELQYASPCTSAVNDTVPTTFYVKVYAATPGTTCLPYSLVITN